MTARAKKVVAKVRRLTRAEYDAPSSAMQRKSSLVRRGLATSMKELRKTFPGRKYQKGLRTALKRTRKLKRLP